MDIVKYRYEDDLLLIEDTSMKSSFSDPRGLLAKYPMLSVTKHKEFFTGTYIKLGLVKFFELEESALIALIRDRDIKSNFLVVADKAAWNPNTSWSCKDSDIYSFCPFVYQRIRKNNFRDLYCLMHED